MISTHHIEELQSLFERLVVLKQGKLLLHESMDQIRERGLWLTGGKNKLDEAVIGREILRRDEVGSMVKVMIDAPFSSDWKAIAQKQGLSIEKAKMQDYLLNITDDQEVSV